LSFKGRFPLDALRTIIFPLSIERLTEGGGYRSCLELKKGIVVCAPVDECIVLYL
jgi:hypothetical protein